MGYNKAREEKKWRQWKEAEERQLRSLGMDEKSIEELHRQDWEDFKRERRYREHQAVFPEQYLLQVVEFPDGLSVHRYQFHSERSITFEIKPWLAFRQDHEREIMIRFIAREHGMDSGL